MTHGEQDRTGKDDDPSLGLTVTEGELVAFLRDLNTVSRVVNGQVVRDTTQLFHTDNPDRIIDTGSSVEST